MFGKLMVKGSLTMFDREYGETLKKWLDDFDTMRKKICKNLDNKKAEEQDSIVSEKSSDGTSAESVYLKRFTEKDKD